MEFNKDAVKVSKRSCVRETRDIHPNHVIVQKYALQHVSSPWNLFSNY